ncbi:hypothetical protein BCR43DRAFT_72846 [Syncephalastrum racemosum]|uniref:Uncharacterized protein n=1 Tax=Syncephalastrum racemosum TaxID=13706 RepID=A0A1X2H284_SYNRA|nr:hypothetical protein BCR43DRAFT_72846 [Syncephalastrum racemosum]
MTFFYMMKHDPYPLYAVLFFFPYSMINPRGLAHVSSFGFMILSWETLPFICRHFLRCQKNTYKKTCAYCSFSLAGIIYCREVLIFQRKKFFLDTLRASFFLLLAPTLLHSFLSLFFLLTFFFLSAAT